MQNTLLPPSVNKVEEMTFEPIKGYPMLHWQGKRPFTSTQYYPAQLKERYGDPLDGWMNRIYWGDNLQVMSHLLKEFRGKVDLVYIDPPFDSKADYKKTVKLHGKSTQSEKTTFEEKQYTDIWSNDEYLQFIYERVILIKEVLSESGFLALQCDWKKSHYIKLIFDEIFGLNNFRGEAIVKVGIKNVQAQFDEVSSLTQGHNVILIYSKSSSKKVPTLRHAMEEDKPGK